MSVLLALCGACAFAQAQPPSRIAGAVDAGRRHPIAHSTHPLATPARDRGRVAADLPLQRMILVLTRSAEQDAELGKLRAARKSAGDPA
jgi:hypothetical protein